MSRVLILLVLLSMAWPGSCPAQKVFVVENLFKIHDDLLLLSTEGVYQRPQRREPVFDCSDVPLNISHTWVTECCRDGSASGPLVNISVRLGTRKRPIREISGDFDGRFETGETLAIPVTVMNLGWELSNLMLLVESDAHLGVRNPEFFVEHLGAGESRELYEVVVDIHETGSAVLDVPLYFVFCNTERLDESRQYLRIESSADHTAVTRAAVADSTSWNRFDRRDATHLPGKPEPGVDGFSDHRVYNPEGYRIEPGPDSKDMLSRVLRYADGDWMRQFVLDCGNKGWKTVRLAEIRLLPGTSFVAYLPDKRLCQGPICGDADVSQRSNRTVEFAENQVVLEFHAADSLSLVDVGFTIESFSLR